MKKAPVKLSQFLLQPNLLSKSIGLTPYEDETQSSRFRKIKNWIFVVFIANLVYVFLQTLMFTLVCIIRRENFLEAILNVSYIGFTSATLMKIFSILHKKHVLTTLMVDVRELFPTDSKLQQEFDMRRFLVRYNRISFGFVCLHQVLVWWYNLYPAVSYLIFDYWLALESVSRRLPYNAWLPWQWQNHWSYYWLYLSQILAGHTSMSSMLAIDLILCAVATQIIMHFSYLARRLENYETTSVYKEDEKFLKDSIEYHQKVINLSAYMNEVFGVSLLINFFSSSFTVCFLGFLVTIGTQADKLVMLVLFLFCSLLQILMICSYGQQLIITSMNIGHAVYNHSWLTADVRYRKMLILIIQRAQRPTMLKATAFLNVSMGTMTALIQLSYKFFALLRTLYSN